MDTSVWRALLAIRQGGEGHSADLERALEAAAPSDRDLAGLYRPLAEAAGPVVIAHLGQSIDGRIALENGQSKWITGRADVVHNHRMRALCDAVIVGARTVLEDDPTLNVREVEGQDPVRVVLDPQGRLQRGHGVFTNDGIRTLVVRRMGLGEAPGAVETLEVQASSDTDLIPVVLEELAERGLARVFVEGGGITVSRFLEAGCLDRLQIMVEPIILGSGRPAITLPAITRVSEALRPPTRRFILGEGMLFEMVFRDRR